MDGGWFSHAAGAELAARHIAAVGADKSDAVALEAPQVSPGGGMGPHAHIHGWRHQHLFVRREQDGRGQIIGDAVGGLGHQIGCRRGDDDQIGRAR